MIYRLLDTMTAYQMAQMAKDVFGSPDCDCILQFMVQPFGQIGMYVKGELPTDVYLKWCDYLRLER